jgi:hypothetical protein
MFPTILRITTQDIKRTRKKEGARTENDAVWFILRHEEQAKSMDRRRGLIRSQQIESPFTAQCKTGAEFPSVKFPH